MLGIQADMWFHPAHTAVNVARAWEGHRAVVTIGDVHHLHTEGGELISH